MRRDYEKRLSEKIDLKKSHKALAIKTLATGFFNLYFVKMALYILSLNT